MTQTFRQRSRVASSLVALASVVATYSIAAQEALNPWREANLVKLSTDFTDGPFAKRSFRALELDLDTLDVHLADAPLEGDGSELEKETLLQLPLPDGGFAVFSVEVSPVMEPELLRRFPEMKAYLGRGRSPLTSMARFDRDENGYRFAFRANGRTVLIDPAGGGVISQYIGYYKDEQEYSPIRPFDCLVRPESSEFQARNDTARPRSSAHRSVTGRVLRIYRIAIATTGEFSEFHGLVKDPKRCSELTGAGRTKCLKNEAFKAVFAAVNRLNMIFEQELGIRFVIAGRSDRIIYTDPNRDPYTNTNAATMLDENQKNLKRRIGRRRYDIGHVFATDGEGLATLQSPCKRKLKARGVTGISAPTGDPFHVDYVAHEIGHQFGAEHTFNGTSDSCLGSRESSTAYEPGSGSTIMGYANLCEPENLQTSSDDYFHTVSFDQIDDYVTSGAGRKCPKRKNSVNRAPVVQAGPDYTIPAETHFTLKGQASDPDGQDVTLTWEQFDLGQSSPPHDDNGNRPLFRSFKPQIGGKSRSLPDPLRIQPSSPLISGEQFPETTRQLNFRLTARDGQSPGGVRYDEMKVHVDGTTGPFQLLEPNGSAAWVAGNNIVRWLVGGSTGGQVNCLRVTISLSLDGGQTFPNVLKSNVINDGEERVSIPNSPTPNARIRVSCTDNIFFAISDGDFEIRSPFIGGI